MRATLEAVLPREGTSPSHAARNRAIQPFPDPQGRTHARGSGLGGGAARGDRPIELGDSWFAAKRPAGRLPFFHTSCVTHRGYSTGSDRPRSACWVLLRKRGGRNGKTGPRRQGRGSKGRHPNTKGKASQCGPSDRKETRRAYCRPGTAVVWAWKRPSPRERVIAQRRGKGEPSMRGSESTA